MTAIFSQGYSIRLLTSLSEEETCRRLRVALRKEGLELEQEVDVSGEIQKHIGLSLRKYIILSVWSPIATYQALLAIPEAGIFVPFHLVVASHDGQTMVTAVNPDWLAQVVDRLGFRLLAKDVSARLRRALKVLEVPANDEHETRTPSANANVEILR